MEQSRRDDLESVGYVLAPGSIFFFSHQGSKKNGPEPPNSSRPYESLARFSERVSLRANRQKTRSPYRLFGALDPKAIRAVRENGCVRERERVFFEGAPFFEFWREAKRKTQPHGAFGDVFCFLRLGSFCGGDFKAKGQRKLFLGSCFEKHLFEEEGTHEISTTQDSGQALTVPGPNKFVTSQVIGKPLQSLTVIPPQTVQIRTPAQTQVHLQQVFLTLPSSQRWTVPQFQVVIVFVFFGFLPSSRAASLNPQVT